MFYTIYKVTNKINGKIYIGAHETKNLDDGYMGSGKVIKLAQKKYGIENFEKEILEFFDDSEKMYEMESVLVTPKFVLKDNNYNILPGGHGGFNHINDGSKEHIEQCIFAGQQSSKEPALDRIKWLMENDKVWLDKKIKRFTKSLLSYYENGGESGFKNKKHSIDTKRKIGIKNSINQTGKKNSQYGTMWIHSLKEKKSKRIKKEDFTIWETKGWLKGRKIKFL